MSQIQLDGVVSKTWPAAASAALRVAFGIIWAVGAALTWSPDFAVHYVGYLHNAAHGQPAWLAGWFAMWIGLVTPHAMLFTWLTRIIETAIALALLTGFARKMLYVVGALFSLLVWSTAEGFGGPYTVGANNMGTAISYVLIFVALIAINTHGRNPYSLDFLIEKRWPRWRRIAEWSSDEAMVQEPQRLPLGVQIPAMLGILVLLVFLIGGLHSTLNVRSPSPTAAAAAVSPLSLASSTPIAAPHDARLPPLIGTGDSVDVHLVVTNDSVAIADGVDYQAWTYGGTVPGPIIHVRQGQTVNVTLTNHGTMEHSIDFHAAQTEPNLNYVDIQPGKSLKFSFVASVPGAFIYHCETQPILLHVANGMYGVLVVDPKTPLPPAAESYVIEQSEWYTQQVADHLMGPNYEKMLAERPDEVVFNGVAFQYREHPLVVTAGKRVRIYFVDAGPNLWTSFHVIGSIFDKVYPDGDPAHTLSDVSTYTVGPGAGAIFDLVIPKPGKYAFVDHDMAHLMKGAVGVFDVRAGGISPALETTAPAPAQAPAAPAPDMAAASAALGPYHFDPAQGAKLYAANCAACHQPTGQGIAGAFPPLKGNPAVLDADPTTQIDTVLNGLHGQNVGGTVYATPMPPFKGVLNDAQIADIINHERTSWDNQGKQIVASDVKIRRAAGSVAVVPGTTSKR
ncbi:multicopper oxidase domain-containing protein [Rhodanobacter sp. 115]|uniref:multicopper oxidase domain-containing protein n=1 Tax=Rhodanobacter sp. FW021-MT20 TaxID=1162282 RepID=UPI00030C61DF|nr:multicopper oxidase domain-containing protein [Rhodanobacter sp. 115]